MKAKIEITGRIDAEPKVMDDNKIKLILRTIPDELIKTENIYVVLLTQRQWDRIKHSCTVKPVFIKGDMEVRKNSKGVAYTVVHATHAEVNNSRVNNSNSDALKKERWFATIPEDQFIELSSLDIFLVEDVHFQGKTMVWNNGRLTPVAVRVLEDGRYGLVVGLSSYLKAVSRRLPLKAYVVDLDYKGFIERFNSCIW